jgi:hypothetical protein
MSDRLPYTGGTRAGTRDAEDPAMDPRLGLRGLQRRFAQLGPRHPLATMHTENADMDQGRPGG